MRRLDVMSIILFTSFITITVMPVLAQLNTIQNQTFTIPAPTETCHYAYTYVYASKGSSLIGNITVTYGKIDFYILSIDEFDNSLGGHSTTCASLQPTSYELKMPEITPESANSISYVAPDNANHYFVFFNPYPNDATVTLVLSSGQ